MAQEYHRVGWGAEWSVVDYVTEEVRRQGHDMTAIDGIERVGWMLDAWRYALIKSHRSNGPTLSDIIAIGKKIEPEKNQHGLRTVGVRVGTRICPPPADVKPRLIWLVKQQARRAHLKPLDFYRELMEIHPFVDGNGRTGKVVLNWMSLSLYQPTFPPNDFWGRWIENP